MFAAAGEGPAFPDDAVEVGRIVGAWGVKGGIRVKPFSADPQALFCTKRWFLQPPAPGPRPGPKPAGSPAGHPAPRPAQRVGAAPPLACTWPLVLRITQAREQGEHIVATAHDLDDRDAAEALQGARVFVSRAAFPTPGDDEFYWVDLIGLAVRNRDGSELGTVAGLIETGPTCVLRVAPPSRAGAEGAAKGDEERLIPFVSAYVDRVDLPGRCVHVDWQRDD